MEILARAVGRRKEAVAQVQMIRGTGQFIINTKTANEYLQNDSCSILDVQAPFEVYKKNSQFGFFSEGAKENAEVQNQSNFNTIDTIVKVKGGGLKGQAEAIRLGISRALCVLENNSLTTQKANTNLEGLNQENSTAVETTKPITLTSSATLKKQFKDKGYLTQDSRVKERRKYGLKKARKASQYHKR